MISLLVPAPVLLELPVTSMTSDEDEAPWMPELQASRRAPPPSDGRADAGRAEQATPGNAASGGLAVGAVRLGSLVSHCLDLSLYKLRTLSAGT